MAEQRSYTGSFNNRWKFTGKELDEETGLYYFGARFYNPVTSLWLSVDPLVEKTMDAYGYCYQNPINLIDPTGMNAVDPSTGDPVNVMVVIWNPSENESARQDKQPEGWDPVIYATDIQDAAKQINSKYNEGQIDNLVLRGHGTSNLTNIGTNEMIPGFNKSKRCRMSNFEYSAFSKGEEISNEYLSKTQIEDMKAFKSISNKVKTEGIYLITNCSAGAGDVLPENIINALGLNQHNVYFNIGNGAFTYGKLCGESIMSKKDDVDGIRHYEKGIRREDYSDLILNCDRNNPITLKR